MSDSTPFLSVVVPVYRGARTVGPLVEKLNALHVPGGHEIVLVNDGSPDDAAAVCRALVAAQPPGVPLTFVDLARNFGEHAAVMAGYRHARGAYVVNIDDDFQNPPEEILAVLRHAVEGGHDVVYTRYAEKHHAGWRNLGSRLNGWLADRLLDKPRGLYLSSFRCVNRLVVDHITRYDGAFPYIDGLIFQVTQNAGTVEVRHADRAEGTSGYTLRRLVGLALNMMVNFSVMPLRLATVLGFVIAGLGFFGALWVVVEYFLVQQPKGWTMTMVAMALFSGTQLIILGIAGEYLGRLHLNANRRPQFVVRAVRRSGAPPAAPTRVGPGADAG
jgi:undecaprenyl-phosphate 4-deoxy-4-formamido-L-arabinose transferase